MDSYHSSIATGNITNSIDINMSVCTPTPIAQLCLTTQGTSMIGSACLSTNVIPGINTQICISTVLPQQSIDNFKFMNDFNFR